MNRDDLQGKALELAGLALFGAPWKTDLARALGVSRHSLDDWCALRRNVPAGVWSDLASLLVQREKEMARSIEAVVGMSEDSPLDM